MSALLSHDPESPYSWSLLSHPTTNLFFINFFGFLSETHLRRIKLGRGGHFQSVGKGQIIEEWWKRYYKPLKNHSTIENVLLEFQVGSPDVYFSLNTWLCESKLVVEKWGPVILRICLWYAADLDWTLANLIPRCMSQLPVVSAAWCSQLSLQVDVNANCISDTMLRSYSELPAIFFF